MAYCVVVLDYVRRKLFWPRSILQSAVRYENRSPYTSKYFRCKYLLKYVVSLQIGGKWAVSATYVFQLIKLTEPIGELVSGTA